MVVVIALAIVYRGKGTDPMAPEAQVPGSFRAQPASAEISGLEAEGQPVIPSLASRQESSGNDLGGKKDPAKRIDGEPDSAHQPDDNQE